MFYSVQLLLPNHPVLSLPNPPIQALISFGLNAYLSLPDIVLFALVFVCVIV